MSTAAKPTPAPSAESSPPTGKSRVGTVLGWCRTHWVLCLVVGSLMIHGVGLTLALSRSKPVVEPLPSEVALGEFHFQPATTLGSRVRSAKFRLHIGLSHPDDRQVRSKLAMAQVRLRQGVEELLRQAQPADFEDPALADLKRQIQQKLNETLAARTVAEVIITELSIERGEAPVQVGATR